MKLFGVARLVNYPVIYMQRSFSAKWDYLCGIGGFIPAGTSSAMASILLEGCVNSTIFRLDRRCYITQAVVLMTILNTAINAVLISTGDLNLVRKALGLPIVTNNNITREELMELKALLEAQMQIKIDILQAELKKAHKDANLRFESASKEVADGFSAVNNRITKVNEAFSTRLNKLDSTINSIDSTIKSTNTKVDNLNTTLNGLTGEMTQILELLKGGVNRPTSETTGWGRELRSPWNLAK